MKIYASVQEIQAVHRLTLPKPIWQWRLETPVHGQINGLDRISGTLIASNGIIAILETEHGQVLFGHREWFVKDAPSHAEGNAKPKKSSLPRARKQALECEYV